MTTTSKAIKRCYVCGSEHEYDVVASTSTFGYSDLDGRPTEPARQDDLLRVLRCPTCGHCAITIEQGPAVAATIVRSQAYQERLSDALLPPRANSWLCAAMIADAAGQPAQAGWGAMRAAWFCDDAAASSGEGGAAVTCREIAITYFRAAQAAGKLFYSAAAGDGGDQLVLADLYRRTRAFERAVALAKEGLALQPDAMMTKLLEYEQHLATRSDAGVHSASEALNAAPIGMETRAHIAASVAIYATAGMALLALYAVRRRRGAQQRAQRQAQERAMHGDR